MRALRSICISRHFTMSQPRRGSLTDPSMTCCRSVTIVCASACSIFRTKSARSLCHAGRSAVASPASTRRRYSRPICNHFRSVFSVTPAAAAHMGRIAPTLRAPIAREAVSGLKQRGSMTRFLVRCLLGKGRSGLSLVYRVKA